MLPSISSGHFGIASKSVYGPDSVQGFGISIVNKPSYGEEDRSVTCPSLPLISEGSFTSLVSKKSGKASEKNNGRGNKDDEVTSSRADSDMQRSSLKMTQLQLNCELKNADRGWCPQGFNPRLANSSRPSQLPVKGLHMMSTSDRLLLQQSLGQPMQNPQRRRDKTAVDRKGYLMTFGGQTNLNSRYRMPAINSPSKEVQSIPSRAPESTSVNLHRRDASKPASVAIHSKCCCRHHKQDDEQRAALKSRSLGSLQSKEGIYKGKKEGSVINQNNNGNTFSNEKRVKPTDRPPPKKLPKTNGISVAQSKKRSKRIINNVLASDSRSSLEEERKRVKRSPPKQTRQKCPKSPEQQTAPLQSNHKNATAAVVASSPTEESQEEVMICVETVRENPAHTDFDSVKEAIELMDVEHNDEEKEFDDREQPDNLDIISVRSSTVCEQQRSATPRLLKVTSEVPANAALAQVFRKLDTDCDGHISFLELKKSLPQHLTRQHINYLKKIYDMACESTYFGLEEFTAAHQMCDLLAQSSPLISNALSNMDSSAMDSWLSAFMELFGKADKSQSGLIDMQSFETLLATVINVQPNSFMIQKILGNLGKSNDDMISGVELLAYIPYFVAVAPKDV